MKTIIAVIAVLILLILLSGCTQQQPQQIPVQQQDPVPLIMKNHSPYDAPRYAGHVLKSDIERLKPVTKYVLK